MPIERHTFKRLVLGLQGSAPDRVIRLAAATAELLDLELLGLFLEDTSLRDLARFPFAREFRPGGGGWHAIDIERLTGDIERAGRMIERMFAEAAKATAIRHQFEIVRGPVAATLPSVSRSGDIVMIIEPASLAERATQQFAWLIEAAFRSQAAVMIVPPRIDRMAGPVLAVAAGADDPSIDAAMVVARAAREEVIVVDVAKSRIDDGELERRAAAAGCRVRHMAVGDSARADTWAFDHALEPLRERLVVLTRGVLEDRRAAAIASLRKVPVLIVEPAGAGA